MTWTGTADIKSQVRRLWDRGDLLRSLLSEEIAYPIKLTFKCPSSSQLGQGFEDVRAWIDELNAVRHIRLGWREVNHRVLGRQRLPDSVWIDSFESAAALIGTQRDAQRFRDVLALTRAREQRLLPWLKRRPLQAVALSDDWDKLLAVVGWIADNPRPRVFLRQVDLPGIHTKFIEAYRGVLTELLDLVLPEEAVAPEHVGADHFAARYGFLEKPVRVRFRVLDETIPLIAGTHCPDVTLDAGSFAALDLPVSLIFFTENETNFLALPPVAGAVVVFGAGYGWDWLSHVRWIESCSVHYWGDIDTHGFAILDQLRSRLREVRSFLMDRETLFAHQSVWGEEPKQVTHDLPRLRADEQALYDDLRDNRIQRNLRLEQEYIGYRWMQAALQTITRPKHVGT